MKSKKGSGKENFIRAEESATETELKKKITDFKNEIAANALVIVNEKMPAKVLSLTQFYKTEAFALKNLTTIHTPVISRVSTDEKAEKKRKIEEITPSLEMIPINSNIANLSESLRLESAELLEMLNTVKAWIQLNIPRIEDGNNFSVGVQEETLSELGRAEETALSIIDAIGKFLASRAKLISKITKYPRIADYQKCLADLDEKQFLMIRISCLELRNAFAVLYDMVIKNLEKLKSPRPEGNRLGLL